MELAKAVRKVFGQLPEILKLMLVTFDGMSIVVRTVRDEKELEL